MDDISLNSGEAILHRIEDLIITGVRYEAVLTGKRLILVTSETGSIHEDIPYTDISLAGSGMNRLREPTLTLTVTSAGGEKRTIELIFVHMAAGQNVAGLGKCITILRSHDIPVEIQSRPAGPAFSGSGQRITPGELVVEGQAARPPEPAWTTYNAPRQGRQPPPEEAPKRSLVMVIAAILFVIVALVVGLVFFGQMFNTKNVTVNQSVTGSSITTGGVSSASPIPTPTPTPPPKVTSGMVSSAPAPSVPRDGVWVTVSYPGNYSGYIGALGRQTEVNSSGTRFYKIPVNNAMVEGSIEKQDGTLSNLIIEVYKNGKLISKTSTSTPFGVADIHTKV